MLLEIIEKMKTDGATHIQIYPHCDHRGYYITGVKLKIMPEKDVLEMKKKELEETIERQTENIEEQRDKLTENIDFLGEVYEKLEKLNEKESRLKNI